MNYQIGIQLLKKKEFNRALNYFENLLNKGNNNIEILFYLGRIYYELNEFKKSIFFYKKCNDLKQNSPNILFNLARVLQSSGKILQAKKIYLDLIEINSNNVRAYFE